MIDHRYLVCVDGAGNHNKFYEATLNDDYSIDVTYGRVGATATKHFYSPYEKDFNSLIRSKEAKGYTDITQAKTVTNQTIANDKDAFKAMDDKDSEDFLKHFLEVCRTRVAQNYRDSKSATPQQIDEVKALIDRIGQIANDKNETQDDKTYRINQALTKIYTVLPRNMGNVKDYLLSNKDTALDTASYLAKIDKIMDKETDLIDSLKVVKTLTAKKTADKTIAEDVGVSIRPSTYAEEDKVRELMDRSKVDDRSSDRREAMSRMFAITNEKSQKAFDACKQKLGIDDDHCKLLFHGSGEENWYSIMQTGLKLKPNAIITGKGLGNGIYFADDINKALNYTRGASSDTRYIGVYEVAVGKAYETPHYNTGYGLHNINGCDSVFLNGRQCGGHHLNEFCIYREEQATLKYIIECNRERQKEVRFSMHLSVPFKDFEDNGDKLKATAVLSDYASEQLKKVTGRSKVGEISCEYDLGSSEFTLYNNDKEVKLSDDEKERLCRDFKKSFFESERDFQSYAKADIAKRLELFAEMTQDDKDEIDDR